MMRVAFLLVWIICIYRQVLTFSVCVSLLKILNQLNMYPFPLQNVTFTAAIETMKNEAELSV